MKTLIVASLLLSSTAFARNYDGCYQLLDTGVMYPAICLSGTIEEGIGGAGVRMAVFGTNTNTLKSCYRSSGLAMDDKKLEYFIEGKKELVLTNFSADGISGDATIGPRTIKFVRLSKQSAAPLIDSAYRGNCN